MGLSHSIHANVYLAVCAVKTLALPRKTGSSGTKFVIVYVLLILFPGISWFCFFCFFHKFRWVILSICTFKAFVVISIHIEPWIRYTITNCLWWRTTLNVITLSDLEIVVSQSTVNIHSIVIFLTFICVTFLKALSCTCWGTLYQRALTNRTFYCLALGTWSENVNPLKLIFWFDSS